MLEGLFDYILKNGIEGVVSDVDGTLRRSGAPNLPSDRVRAAVHELNETSMKVRGRSFPVIMATAAPWRGVDYLARELGLYAPQITSQGAEVTDPISGLRLWHYPLSHATTLGIAGHLFRNGFLAGIQDNGLDYPVDVFESYIPENPYIVMGDIKANQALEFRRVLHSLWGDINTHLVITPPGKSHLTGVHVTEERASKAQAIRQISLGLGLDPNKLLGMGDGPNDTTLLQACGTRVALLRDNQQLTLQLAGLAQFIAPSLSNDGAAEVIETVTSALRRIG